MLIFLEGLPASGKSTNSGFLFRQFESNGHQVEWIHEVSYPHPVVFFREASLTHDEMNCWLAKFPTAKHSMQEVATWREKDVGIRLLELSRLPDTSVPAQAKTELMGMDVHQFPIERYNDVALAKWANFLGEVRNNPGRVYLLDSCVFQFQIFAFLLQDRPRYELRKFVSTLWDMIEPFATKLIQFYRPLVDALMFMRQTRGQEFFEHILARDGSKPYYVSRGRTTQAVEQFFHDYHELLDMLFRDAPCAKIAVDVANGDWETCEQALCDFVGIRRLADLRASLKVSGTYLNDGMELQIEVDGTQLYLIDANGNRHTLYPRTERQFYVGDVPVVLHIPERDRLIIEGNSTIHRWTQTGLRFTRVDP